MNEYDPEKIEEAAVEWREAMELGERAKQAQLHLGTGSTPRQMRRANQTFIDFVEGSEYLVRERHENGLYIDTDGDRNRFDYGVDINPESGLPKEAEAAVAAAARNPNLGR